MIKQKKTLDVTQEYINDLDDADIKIVLDRIYFATKINEQFIKDVQDRQNRLSVILSNKYSAKEIEKALFDSLKKEK
jgi:hypothetical protein